jgi:allantoin racemase
MKVLVVNPNTSREMTETIRTAAESAGYLVGVDVAVVHPESGPASIEGHFDEVVSAYWTLDCVLRVVDDFDGVVVACYGAHPVIDALREAITAPVLGIMEASVLYALPLGARFSIVTTSPRWQPMLEEAVRALGVERRCASVRSTGLAVLDLERLPPQQVRARLADEARSAIERDGAEVIVLGCAGMAGLQESVAAATGVPVIDAVVAGVAMVSALAKCGARTSKRNLYGAVDPRPGVNVPPGLARIYSSRASTESGPTSS